MTKAELIDEIVFNSNVKREDATETIEKAMKVIKAQIVAGNGVYLRGFGSFIPKIRKQKPARNITTGERVLVPERAVPSFIPAKEFKDQVIESSTIKA